jgi:NAD(P)-dependent dehydrogenase (short-subunit alcohol dehydrogenase family)
MDKVCVITGGGSGMGLATAEVLGKEMRVVIAGRSDAKLQRAAASLAELGIEVEPMPRDMADRASIEALADRARSLGEVAAVINAAGMSPGMGEGSCIVDVASMAGYLVPRIVLYPAAAIALAEATRASFSRR